MKKIIFISIAILSLNFCFGQTTSYDIVTKDGKVLLSEKTEKGVNETPITSKGIKEQFDLASSQIKELQERRVLIQELLAIDDTIKSITVSQNLLAELFKKAKKAESELLAKSEDSKK